VHALRDGRLVEYEPEHAYVPFAADRLTVRRDLGAPSP
jgi:hypothetical protein